VLPFRVYLKPCSTTSSSESQPAFLHGYEYIRGKKLGVIRLNSVVGERMARDPIKETLHPRHLPMLVKPRAWEDYDKGGYLTLRCMFIYFYYTAYVLTSVHEIATVMRIKDSIEQRSYLRHASSAGHLDLVYECLDALGETPWRINENILRVVLDVWNRGDGAAGIPPAQ
jgi:DNA-directed RNA polymerase